MEGRENPVLPPPSPLPTAAMAARPSSPLVTPNTHKDLPSSSRHSAFWGGNSQLGHITSVHMSLTPDFPALASAALMGKDDIAKPPSPQLQENINPALNAPIFSSLPTKFSEQSNAAHFEAFPQYRPLALRDADESVSHLILTSLQSFTFFFIDSA